MKFVKKFSFVFLLFIGCANVNPDVDLPQNYDEAMAAITFRTQVDKYLSLQNSVLRRAASLQNLTHQKDAANALISLDKILKDIDSELSGLTMHKQDQIDYILLKMSAQENRFRIEESIKSGAKILELFPASNLRLQLPILTGIVADDDYDKGINAMIEAEKTMFSGLDSGKEFNSLSIAQSTARKANALKREINTWAGRAKNRFETQSTQSTQSLDKITKSLLAKIDRFNSRLNREVISKLSKNDSAFGTPIGRDAFDNLLKNRHMLTETPEELLEFGKQQMVSISAKIAEVAKRIDPNKTAEEVWEQLKTEHPSKKDLPQFAYDEMIKARDHLLATDAITIPEDARDGVMLITEGFTHQTYPFGGYGGRYLEGDKYVGRFMTSPPNISMNAEDAESRLRGNNYYWARVVAVHEMYPGHHLQGMHTLKARIMRQNFSTTTLSEGWGLYSEQMMFRLGFFPDDKTEMAMYMMRIWRAARIVIDVSLHLELMTMPEAIQYLIDNVDMDRENSTAEVRRYIGNPTRPFSYLYGYTQIEALRADYITMKGDSFTEKEFHDTLLSYGRIPIKLIRAGMLGEELPKY